MKPGFADGRKKKEREGGGRVRDRGRREEKKDPYQGFVSGLALSAPL